MAFMEQPKASSSSEDRVPILNYNAKAGRIFLHDRAQDANGVWTTNKTDITMSQPAFAVDFGRLEFGWAYFAAGQAPMFSLAFFGQPTPTRPSSPGSDDNGKPAQFKSAFRVLVMGSAIGGVRELSGNSGAIIGGMNELHTAYEAAPEAKAGKIPLVKMTNVLEVKAGQSSNFQPVFAIQGWVDRPEVLGARMVPPPGGNGHAAPSAAPPVHTAPAPSSPPPNHVPPPHVTAHVPENAKPAGMPDW
jgi:hypothetical protein